MALCILGTVATILPTASGAATRTVVDKPKILAVTGRMSLSWRGGSTQIVVETVGAVACAIELRGHPRFGLKYGEGIHGCGTGTFTVTIKVGSNPFPANNSAVFWVLANGNKTTVKQAFTIRVRADRSTTSVLSSPTPTTVTTIATTTAPPASAGPISSPTWSGYVVPSSTSPLTAVTGEWTVPTLNCSATPAGGASTWVGIGGQNWPTGGDSGTLLQTGVTTNCVEGVQQDEGWWEEYPSAPNELRGFADFAVSPGDSIQASVYQATDGSWETRVDDLTKGLSGWMDTGEGWGVAADSGNGRFVDQGSTANLSYSGGYTAEWIVEDYALNGSTVPFADYRSVTFTNLETSLSNWSLTAAEGEEIVQDGTVLSTPSAPATDAFSVSYTG